MPELLFQLFTITADILIFGFVIYYFLKFQTKEKEIEKKEGKIDTNYHQVVDNALSKERKILEDATNEADQIITGAQYVSRESKEAVNQALQTMVVDIQKEAIDTARNFMNTYQVSLKQLAMQSLHDFQNVVKGLETDLQKEVKDFHETLLPKMEKELDEYKQSRLAQTEDMVVRVVQKVSQEVLNKSLSLDDHQKLVIEALEKAKKEGALN